MPDANWSADRSPFTDQPNRAQRLALSAVLASDMNGTEELPSVFRTLVTPGTCGSCYGYRNNAVVSYRNSYGDQIRACMNHALEAWLLAGRDAWTCMVCDTPSIGRGHTAVAFRRGLVQGNPNPGSPYPVCYPCAGYFRACSECDTYYNTRKQEQCCERRPRCVLCGDRAADGTTLSSIEVQNTNYTDVRVARTMDGVCANCLTVNIGRCIDCDMNCERRGLYVMEDGRHACVGCVANYWPSLNNWRWNVCGRHGRAYREGIDEIGCCDPHASIHNYSYKPRAQFQGTGPLFLGAEIEISTQDRDLSARVAGKGFKGLVYLKEDGSIRSGFEMVTHPMSYAYWISEFPWDTFAKLRESGATEHASCGIHVHASRAGFSSAAHEHRWLVFFDRNQAPIELIARRKNSSYAQFGRLSAREKKHIATHRRGRPGYYERYCAVNVNNEHTYEVRIFATSLDVQSVKAAIGFVSASIEYTRTLKARDVLKGGGFTWSEFRDWVAERPEYAALSAEMIRVGA